MSARHLHTATAKKASVLARLGEPIPAAPFVAWCQAQAADIEGLETNTDANGVIPTNQILAARLGVSERTVYRYLRSLDGENQPTDTYHRFPVEDAIEHAGGRFCDLYPDLDTPVELEPVGWCPRCYDEVHPIDGRCPWCDGALGKRRAGQRRTLPRQRVTDDQLRKLHALHVAHGLPTTVLARQVWERLGYRSDDACDEAIRRGWKRLGLERLPAGESVRYWRRQRPAQPLLDEQAFREAVWMHTRLGLTAVPIAQRLLPRATCDSARWLARWLLEELKRTGHYSDLTPGQREILRLARRPEGIRTRYAARVLAGNRRGQPINPARDYSDVPAPKSSAAATATLKSLVADGLLYQHEDRGPYFATDADEERQAA